MSNLEERYMSDQQGGEWAESWLMFASVTMIIVGALQTINGLVALLNDEFYVNVRDYTFKFDITQWGAIHVVLGIVLILAGIGIFSGNVLARSVGVTIAALSTVANFMSLPYYPVWSVIIIAINIILIWALTVYGRALVREN